MQQRQLRLGDILDDYCPRERRVTNHAVVAMVGPEVKQTRCTTCEAEHEYKHAKVPRQRRKTETPAALYSQVLANGPKRVTHETDAPAEAARDAALDEPDAQHAPVEEAMDALGDEAPSTEEPQATEPTFAASPSDDDEVSENENGRDEGPVHRPLIRASLPRPEGQAPPARPLPEFTIRQPGAGRPNRFRPRHPRGGQQGHQFHGGGNRSNGNVPGGPARGGMPRHAGGNRPPMSAKRHHGGGRKRSK